MTLKPAVFIKSTLTLAVLSANYALAANDADNNFSLPAIVVTSGFRGAAIQEVPTSLTVVNDQVMEERNADHLEDLINLAPNVNSSSGASRAKYFQIRGIGERSQFIGPINPSVGVIMDGIDMSNIGGAATMLDAQQVEILRGPQGTLYGANALAGLINIRSNDPTTVTTGNIETTISTYNTRRLSAAVGGPINDSVGYRVAFESNKSDGFTENDYLNKDNTNNIDEALFRGKLRIEASDYHMIDLTAFYANIDNGYDAFSLDNTRTTLSDEPGHDRQETSAFAAKSTWTGHDAFTLETSLSYSDSDLEYGYDEDWAYDGFHPWGYNSFDNYIRNNKTTTAEARLISAPNAEIFNATTTWVTGLYYYNRSSDLQRQYTYLPNDFTSEYDTTRISAYGEFETSLSEQYILTTGLRIEHSESEYKDNDGAFSNPEDLLVGGRAALEYLVNQNTTIYGLISRGYKVGGYNANGSLPDSLKEFDTEYLWNYEVGSKNNWMNNRLQTQISLFYQQRENAQIKGYRTIANPGGGTSFIDFVGNTDEAYSYGLEAEARWEVNTSVSLFGSLGLLNTKLEDSSAAFDGREAAQAPSYQYTLGANFNHGQGWFSGIDIEGKDEFYFSDSHNQTSEAYTLLNARLGYKTKDWSVTLWGKNLTDEDTYVRGFYFGNDPRTGYADTLYTQLGAPRQLGLTAKMNF
ncbi:TonB-dependent receptor [Neptunomonas qingdaonensis]|uniref:Outer membrane receptor for ferrienterochelin and colicins n=1 Tax=Neptunomonas qingdaonensis TaxID=1045558 RepID=A0A1I2T6M8_9GAMM|nr:TonB-dependent receptor [Neptunomonas qingdaonensis]SFG58877.1 Outer membrane receptor for ferrienterochelin and colicins [Neptunomonas qingdaonensis]